MKGWQGVWPLRGILVPFAANPKKKWTLKGFSPTERLRWSMFPSRLAKTLNKKLKVCSCLKYWLTLPRKNFIALCWICYKLLMFLLVYTVEPSYNEDPVVMKNICKSSRIIVKYVETNLAVTNSTITNSQNKI